jgi:hypothetical protein
MWYPLQKEKLIEVLDSYLKEDLIKKHKTQRAHGIIVPHAGYEYSGEIAGKAYSYIKGWKKAVILSPNHYFPLNGVVSHNDPEWQTPLGKVKIIKNNFRKANLTQEHAIDNQIPFLQKLGIKEILPLVIGEINEKETHIIAKQLEDYSQDCVFIISSDLSHFLDYSSATARDNLTIKAIEKLDSKKLKKYENSACGIFPLLILIELCKIKGWKPKLLEYKNSGDITGDKDKVVGYASLTF